MIIKKVAAGLASGAIMATMFAGSAFADSCTISNNQLALNKCKIVNVNKTKTVQVNNAFVSNSVGVSSTTGGNGIGLTNGGSNTITTGDSDVTVRITNNVNANVLIP